MDCSEILHKLTEIQRAVGVQDPPTIRRMLIEVEDLILESQKQLAKAASSSGPANPHPQITLAIPSYRLPHN